MSARAEAPLAESTGLTETELRPATYTLVDAAAGLESMLLGEPQILGQIAKAYSTALANAAAHTISTLSLVNRLFHAPMLRLHAEAEQGQCAGYSLAVRDLFGLHR